MKKPNISQGEWQHSRYGKGNIVSLMSDGSDRGIANCMVYSTNTDNGMHIEESINNAELVITAGNLTNKGLNIGAIEEMYEVLQDTLECLINIGCTDESEAVKNIKQALKNAKYE